MSAILAAIAGLDQVFAAIVTLTVAVTGFFIGRRWMRKV